jgi:hypothetical protein
MKIRFFSLVSFLFAVTLFVGCTQQAEPTTEEQNEGQALTAVQVLQKSAETMNKEKGFLADSHQEQKVHMGKVEQSTTTEMEIKVVNNPAAMHIVGESKQGETKTPVEMVVVDGQTYMKVGDKWIEGGKAKEENTDHPTARLEKTKQALAGLKENKEVKMTKEGNFYLVEITKEAVENEQFKPLLVKEVKAALESQDQKKWQVDKMKFDKYSQKIWIDDKTFKYAKQWVEYSLTIPSENKESLQIDLKLTLNIKGPFTGKIEKPVQK